MREESRQQAAGRRQKAAGSGQRARFLSLVLSASRLLPAASCPLAQAGELKIGYVNLAKVFDNYEKTKASDSALEKKGKQKEAELEGRMNELKKLRQGLELLNDEVKEAKASEIETKSEELQRFRNATARDLRRERDRIAKDILEEIRGMLKEYAEANGFAVILDSRSLVFGQHTYDVTEDVLKLLNSRAKKAAP